MMEFLSSLNVDENGKSKINQAIEHEKLFKEIFENPSENVIKTELSKIQLKWLANDHQGGQKYIKSTFKDFINATQEYQKQASGSEKKYFDGILSHFENFIDLQGLQEEPEHILLEDNKNILKILFEKIVPANKKIAEKISEPISETVKTAAKSNKKLYIILGSVVAGLGALAFVFGKKSKSTQPQSKPVANAQLKSQVITSSSNVSTPQPAITSTTVNNPFNKLQAA